MGKWTDRLALLLAEEKTQTPPTGALPKLSKGGAEGLLSVLAVPTLGDAENFSAAATDLAAAPRPYKLTRAEADEAHRTPWDDAAIARFVARVALFMRRGLNATDADDLAERLHLRDVHSDHRVICLECRHLAGTAATGWRCGNHKAAVVARELAAELVTTFQVCPGFNPAR